MRQALRREEKAVGPPFVQISRERLAGFQGTVPCRMFHFTKRDVCGEIEDERSDKYELYAEVSTVSARRGL